tara:strand:+ start:201 stop:332 length:132 start_codon:yes stop_codon:yes gene_type:complete
MNSQELEILAKLVILGGFTIFLHTIDRFYRKTYKRNEENKKNV